MSLKTLLKSLLLIGLGILLGYGWFRFGGVIAPVVTQQHATTTILTHDLPRLDAEFKGKIGRSYRQSSPHYPQPPSAAPGSPNILIILTDDVGFASSSTFGGPVPTPTLDKLASGGLLYNRFHTTAMCSPTRAAMLTGRNSHMVGSGMISNLGTGYPGYSSAIPRSAATIGRVLTGNSYNTAFFENTIMSLMSIPVLPGPSIYGRQAWVSSIFMASSVEIPTSFIPICFEASRRSRPMEKQPALSSTRRWQMTRFVGYVIRPRQPLTNPG